MHGNSVICRLQIILSSVHDALELLTNYERKDELYLSSDVTPRQQNCTYLLVRSEFKRRKRHNETSIMLLYKNSVQNIITKDVKK